MDSKTLMEHIYKSEILGKHIREKIKEIEYIIPKEYFNFDDFYFAGGCIYSIWNNTKPKDYDIFCKNPQAIKKLKKFFKLNKIASCQTKNAITMGDFQFVIKHIGKPEVEVNKFDFKHNMFYYDSKIGLQTLSGWQYLDSGKLEFNDNRPRDLLNILTRIPKFLKRGMEIDQDEILNILETGTRFMNIFKERKYIKDKIKGKDIY